MFRLEKLKLTCEFTEDGVTFLKTSMKHLDAWDGLLNLSGVCALCGCYSYWCLMYI